MEEDAKYNTKISGYLEKKGKMKMMGSYKRYWFVLEGRLLLYYRSKDEYEAISPCKGSINLGPPCNVKPCPSLAGVFQVEARNSTVTLRAETREEQNRWMQAIMTSLNQTKNSPAKLTHFRYSLDELPQAEDRHAVLERQNTVPQRPKSSPKVEPNKGIIQRLQKMGAQSYCGSIGTVNRMGGNRRSQSSRSSNSEESLSNFRGTILVENDQYGVLKRHSISGSVEIRSGIKPAENIYERILDGSSASADGKEANYSVPTKNVEIREATTREPGENGRYSDGTTPNYRDRPTTLLIENDTYSCASKKGNSRLDGGNVEDHQYCTADELNGKPNRVFEAIYTEPKYSDLTDHNENNLTMNNEEPAYSVAKLFTADKGMKGECDYEDPDQIYSQLKRESPESCKEPTIKKTKSKKEKKAKAKSRGDEEKKEPKLKKSSSFIRRVWKRKAKSKEKEKEENIDEEEIYQTVPSVVVEKLSITDETAVQMLSELHNILENKKPLLIDKISGSRCSTPPKSDENMNKTFDKIKSSNDDSAPTSPAFPSEKSFPLLPPKCQKQDNASPYHDFPKNNQPIKLLPPKTKKLLKSTAERVKSIDEILEDLDQQKPNDVKENKVKRLIKRFSEPEFTDKDVVLRTRRPEYCREEIDCDELNRLLEELTKVTSAPILTPGVTTSLIGHNLTDQELIQLLPTRRRRYSEPDYDIPRPHKSLVNLPRKENPSGIVIESTRFFGPILKPSDINIKKNQEKASEDSPRPNSMTPDSLEPDLQLTKIINRHSILEEEKISYTSHNYVQEKNRSLGKNESVKYIPKLEKCIKSFDDIIIENDIYAEPKSLYNLGYKINETENSMICKKIASAELDEDVFVDSLEICTSETSTAF